MVRARCVRGRCKRRLVYLSQITLTLTVRSLPDKGTCVGGDRRHQEHGRLQEILARFQCQSRGTLSSVRGNRCSVYRGKDKYQTTRQFGEYSARFLSPCRVSSCGVFPKGGMFRPRMGLLYSSFHPKISEYFREEISIITSTRSDFPRSHLRPVTEPGIKPRSPEC